MDAHNEIEKEIRERIERIDDIFMPNGTTPKCMLCGNAMKNHIPKHGKFKGQKQEHSWVCNCKDYPKGIVLSVG